MKDRRGKVIYVGKAKNLRNRVRNYFHRSGDNRPFVKLLDRILADIETVITSSEKEALLLENNLIKQHKPRFNVRLVDDKNYLVLRLDVKTPFPRLEVTRKIREDGARYFGPYHSARSCRQTLDVIGRHFRLRTCPDQVMKGRKRPCLEYQIKRCDAPCVLPVSQSQYADQVRDVALFLDHKSNELKEGLRTRMIKAADDLEFETAAALRDQLSAIETTLERQQAVATQFVDQDVIGYHRQGDVLQWAVLLIREGKLCGRRTFRSTDQEFPDDESVSGFVSQYYDRPGVDFPDEVLLPLPIEDEQAKADWLRERSQAVRSRKVCLLCPRRGPKQKLVELAMKNAAAVYASRRNRDADAQTALLKLQRRLGLKKLPVKIECFDISHWQGTDTVASRVVFIDGEPAKHLYRTFKVRSVQNDDFAAMYEVVSRRFRRAVGKTPGGPAAMAGEKFSAAQVAQRRSAALFPLSVSPGARPHIPPPTQNPPLFEAWTPEDLETHAEAAFSNDDPQTVGENALDAWAMPDLVVIDGGKGQLASALAALKDVGVNWSQNLDVVALAKETEDVAAQRKPDRVFLPRTKEPIRLRENTAELFVLSRIRDEAHRFAVGFHQKLREKRTICSKLAEIPGIGKKRQQLLLKTLGSVRRVESASLAELCAVPGLTTASASQVYRFFHPTDGVPETADRANRVDRGSEETSPNAATVELMALTTEENDEDLERSVQNLLRSAQHDPEDAKKA